VAFCIGRQSGTGPDREQKTGNPGKPGHRVPEKSRKPTTVRSLFGRAPASSATTAVPDTTGLRLTTPRSEESDEYIRVVSPIWTTGGEASFAQRTPRQSKGNPPATIEPKQAMGGRRNLPADMGTEKARWREIWGKYIFSGYYACLTSLRQTLVGLRGFGAAWPPCAPKGAKAAGIRRKISIWEVSQQISIVAEARLSALRGEPVVVGRQNAGFDLKADKDSFVVNSWLGGSRTRSPKRPRPLRSAKLTEPRVWSGGPDTWRSPSTRPH